MVKETASRTQVPFFEHPALLNNFVLALTKGTRQADSTRMTSRVDFVSEAVRVNT